MALINESTLQRRLIELERFVKAIGGDTAATVSAGTGLPVGLANQGDIWLDTDTNALYVYTEGVWLITTTFDWVKYASEINNIQDDGSVLLSGDVIGFSSTLNRNVKWIGEAVNQITPTTSNSPTDYIWRLAPAGLINDLIIDTSAVPGVPKNLLVTEELYQTNTAAGVASKVKLTWAANIEAAYSATATTLVEYKPQYFGSCDINNPETNTPFVLKRDCEANTGTWTEVNTTDDDYIPLIETPNLFAATPDMIPGTVDFRLTAISKLGVRSSSIIREDFVVYGVSGAPISPTNLTLASGDSTAVLSWDKSTELDVVSGGSVQIRIHPSTGANATWSTSQVLVDALQGATTSKTVPLIAGTYLVKFVDSTGKYSATASVVTNTFAPSGFNFVSLSDEHAAGYLGLKTNCVVDAGDLEKRPDALTGTVSQTSGSNTLTGVGTLFLTELTVGDYILVDSQTRHVHSIETNLSLTVDAEVAIPALSTAAKANLSMTYDFDGYTTSNVDLGIVKSVKITPSFSALIYKTTDQICSADSICNLTQVCVAEVDADIIFYLSTSDDLVTWSDYTNLITGNYNHRAYRFRLVVTAQEANTSVDFSALSIAVDTVDLIKTGSVDTLTTADVTYTYPISFYSGVAGTTLPRLGFQVIGGTAGDAVTIASSSATEFSISVYNNGARVARSVDFQAIGQ